MTFDQILTEIYDEQMVINQSELEYTDLEYKDETKSRETGFCLEHVRYLRETSPIFLRTYLKDPFKQNITEKALKLFLETELGIEIKKLPSSGSGALSIAGGALLHPSNARTNAKTIDFHWQCPFTGKKAYAAHKYTRGDGGSQDGVRKELEHFLEDGRVFTGVPANKNTIIFAIADGSHYVGRHRGMTDRFGREDRAICTPADGIRDIWEDFCLL